MGEGTGMDEGGALEGVFGVVASSVAALVSISGVMSRFFTMTFSF
jgi:predicted amino acid-binding ACT domain protein